MIELGGNIKLVGFNDLDPGMLVVAKKLVGSYARKISDNITQFQELCISIKTNDSKKVEMEGKLITDSETLTTEVSDSNLFFAMNKTLNDITLKAQK